MAPLGMVPRHYLCDQGQGYSKSCISGQAENDVVMRAFAEGGNIINVPDSKVYLNHEEVHGHEYGHERDTGKDGDEKIFHSCPLKGYRSRNFHSQI